MKKLSVLLMVMVIFLFLLNSPVTAAPLCSKATVGSYEINCGVADGFCPENYGDWSTCQSNAYNGKCTPCDIDCPSSGFNCNLDILYPSNPVRPSNMTFNSPLPITAIARDITNSGNLKILTENMDLLSIGGSCTPSPGQCSITTTVIAPAGGNGYAYIGGVDYTYKNQFVTGSLTYIIQKSGATAPSVIINQLKKFGGGEGDVIKNYKEVNHKINIPVEASSLKKITKIYALLYREDQGTYKPAYPLTVNCLATCVSDGVCNVIGTVSIPNQESPQEQLIPWDTTICDNGNYRIIVKAEDTRGSTAPGDSQIDITLNNPTPPPTQPLPTELLNLVFVKVKTWILTLVSMF